MCFYVSVRVCVCVCVCWGGGGGGHTKAWKGYPVLVACTKFYTDSRMEHDDSTFEDDTDAAGL